MSRQISMSDEDSILNIESVKTAARTLRASEDPNNLRNVLLFTRALAEARKDEDAVKILSAELDGYETHSVEIPDRRRVIGFASSFPVRAIGHLDPEEIFLANRDKFAQVSLTMGQALEELSLALDRLDESGVIELRVPASEITGEAASVDASTEIHIYILPSEILNIIHATERLVLDEMIKSCVEASIGPNLSST